ncbi:response regulator transcription factor [Acetobacteraceae bacterium ESL0709]|nr:response regulator transcription factor [Acetobacteraceae bacterium ESL0697]MDF7678701.1 response regulator transcription factor [Acetobacteraceae bacterium ESL0709]
MVKTRSEAASLSEQQEDGKTRLLLVEDDSELAAEIKADLEERGYLVEHSASGTQGLELARENPYKLMIIDRMLPGLDGLSVVATLRNDGIMLPVLVLSALSAVDDRVTGLKAGGDDYLTKPFAPEELAVRLEVLLRRPLTDTRQTILQVGPLKMDLIERRVWRQQRELELLPREFRLLEYLMRRPDTVVTRSMLLEEVWNYRFTPQTNLVDVHIGKLRRKVDGENEIPLIRSIRGVGFSLNVEP